VFSSVRVSNNKYLFFFSLSCCSSAS